MQATEIEELLRFLTPEERAEVEGLLAADTTIWSPLPGPQTLAYFTQADITGFGGAAGGGKTDLACGLALTEHEVTAIFRENGTELTGVTDRLRTLVPGITFDRLNVARFTTPDGKRRQIELGSFPNPNDETKYQGRPHDLIIYDEAANMRESAVRFLMGWNRNAQNPNQRCRVLMCFNPPTTAEGRWITKYFGPWLDKKHPNPAKPGELRWFAVDPATGDDIEVPDGRQFVFVDGERDYGFDPAAFNSTDIVVPKSRTFIPSRVTDNPYLAGTGYIATLQSLPEPLRSQMLNGDFSAGIEDDPWQVIPTAWVEAAQARWQDLYPKPEMDSTGVDVARGGKDNTVIARRHGMWFDRALAYPGAQTPDGPTVAGLAIAAARNGAPIHIDIIGVGASPYDYLNTARQHVIGVNVAEKATSTDRSGRLQFANQRSQYWWQFREALDPANNTGIALPPDPQLLADLTAPKWELRGSTIQVESRDAIVKRIGRSPDWASAFILALIDTPKMQVARAIGYGGVQGGSLSTYDPYANM